MKRSSSTGRGHVVLEAVLQQSWPAALPAYNKDRRAMNWVRRGVSNLWGAAAARTCAPLMRIIFFQGREFQRDGQNDGKIKIG